MTKVKLIRRRKADLRPDPEMNLNYTRPQATHLIGLIAWHNGNQYSTDIHEILPSEFRKEYEFMILQIKDTIKHYENENINKG